jgi:adenylate cyclase
LTKIIDTERRLVAIFAADVEGYSRLMGTDEVGTMRDMTQRRTILDGLIAAHRGRIANTAGDSVLAEFGSAVDAVRCAVEAQEALAEANTGASPDRHINFRIGVHVGDVMVKGGDLFGDGVNIAARLQTLARAGSICVSGVAHDQVRKILPFAFTDLGAQQVKNIEEPIRAFSVSVKGASAAATSLNTSMPLSLPDKPSIAVLPFQNMSGDPEQEYFADGMVEDIITALSRFKSLFVIARNSSFTYKGKAVDIKQVGRELGVRYVLEGSVRKAGNRVRITGQLIEAATDRHLWADKFDGALEDIFDLQDKVSEKVVTAIAPRVWDAEINRSKQKPTEQLEAYDFLLRSLATFVPGDRGAVEAAHVFALKAIELDPEFGTAYARASVTYVARKQGRWMKDVTSETAEGLRLARLAVRFGKDDDIALSLGAMSLGYLGGEVEAGASFLDQALVLNPNSDQAWANRAWFYIWQGQHDRAIEYLSRAIRLNPRVPIVASSGMGLAHLFSKRWREAEVWAGEATHRAGTFLPPLRCLAASLAFQGKIDEAKKVGALILQLDPSYCLSNIVEYLPIQREEDISLMTEGLRLAGIPE